MIIIYYLVFKKTNEKIDFALSTTTIKLINKAGDISNLIPCTTCYRLK